MNKMIGSSEPEEMYTMDASTKSPDPIRKWVELNVANS